MQQVKRPCTLSTKVTRGTWQSWQTIKAYAPTKDRRATHSLEDLINREATRIHRERARNGKKEEE